MKYVLNLVSIFMLFGCATVELSETGKEVRIVDNLNVSEVNQYEEIGEISCSFGFNGKRPATNITQCRNDLRNKAAELGAKILVISHQQIGTAGSGFGQNAVAGCPNCITMVGTAYK